MKHQPKHVREINLIYTKRVRHPTLTTGLLFNRLGASRIIHVLHFKVTESVCTAIAQDFRDKNDVQCHVFHWKRVDDVLLGQGILQSEYKMNQIRLSITKDDKTVLSLREPHLVRCESMHLHHQVKNDWSCS